MLEKKTVMFLLDIYKWIYQLCLLLSHHHQQFYKFMKMISSKSININFDILFCIYLYFLKSNLLLPDCDDKDTENVKYLVNIFEGSFIVKRDYIIQVSFGSYHV